MKAAPLLRRWTTSLKSLGVTFHMRHKLSSIRFTEHSVVIAFEDEDTEYEFDHLILALGGASWPSSGSDGKWVEILAELGIGIIPLSSANCGWHIEWNHKFLAEAEGLPLKNIQISSLDQSLEGELVITKYGLEGGPIYRLGPSIRKFSSLTLDLKPTFRAEQLIAKMESVKKNIFTEAVRRWKLNPASSALLKHQFNAEALDIQQLAKLVKNLELQATKPRPIEEAISSAGGIAWKEISPDLSLKKHPLLSVAGEMIDWEAPTGGYLIQGCLATGHFAAVNAVRKAMLKG